MGIAAEDVDEEVLAQLPADIIAQVRREQQLAAAVKRPAKHAATIRPGEPPGAKGTLHRYFGMRPSG